MKEEKISDWEMLISHHHHGPLVSVIREWAITLGLPQVVEAIDDCNLKSLRSALNMFLGSSITTDASQEALAAYRGLKLNTLKFLAATVA